MGLMDISGSPVGGHQDPKAGVKSQLGRETPRRSLAPETGKMQSIASAVDATIIERESDRSFETDEIICSSHARIIVQFRRVLALA